MAALTNAERAPLVVTTATGVVVPPAAYAVSVDETQDIIDVTNIGGTVYVIGKHAGTAAVLVSADGSSGSLVVTVTEAPLTVTIGAPEPK